MSGFLFSDFFIPALFLCFLWQGLLRNHWHTLLRNHWHGLLRNSHYALKEFRNRWYVVGKDLKDNKIKSFGLDRLSKLDFTGKHFALPDNFEVNEHYKNCFGIISPNADKPQEIILSFDPFQGKYIKSLPLHASQEILEDNEDELLIKLTLYITHDFVMELLSYGENVKVIEPIALIEQMKQSYKNALDQY